MSAELVSFKVKWCVVGVKWFAFSFFYVFQPQFPFYFQCNYAVLVILKMGLEKKIYNKVAVMLLFVGTLRHYMCFSVTLY